MAGLMLLCAFMAGGAGAHSLITSEVNHPKTVSQCKKKYAHNPKARTACLKRVRHTGKSNSNASCTLETSGGNTGAETGDTKDFGVKVRALGEPSPSEVEVVVEVTTHKPGITVCSAVLYGIEPIESDPTGPTGDKPIKEVSLPVTFSPHSKVSHPLVVPSNFDVPVATVKARRG